MTYEKQDDEIVLTLDKDDAKLMVEVISSACLPQKRNFVNLKKFIEDSFLDVK